MASPFLSQVLRQLFAPSRACLRPKSSFAQYKLSHRRYYGRQSVTETQDKWQQRLDAFPADMTAQLKSYPMVTARELRGRHHRPRRVKMLARDFIEDSLYNPSYGYFCGQATIFEDESIPFHTLPDEPSFSRLLESRYTAFEDALDTVELNDTRQLWHTPTSLFAPYYGEAIARYLVANYRLTLFPYHDLIIYELGGGNGTLMRNILDYIAITDPDVYARTQYKVIEISPSLANLQSSNLSRSELAAEHASHIQIINASILDWKTYVHSPVYVLALEILDNLAHDVVRRDPTTNAPMQGAVLIDQNGDFFEYFLPQLDPLVTRYLEQRGPAPLFSPSRPHFEPQPTQQLQARPLPPPPKPSLRQRFRHSLPLAPNLTTPEWLPTNALLLFETLRTFFPAHRLVVADFHSLPGSIAGINAPVVQTRYMRQNVSVSTPYVHQGYFDIFFPTDFRVLEHVYRRVTGKLTRVLSQGDFLARWEDGGTKVKSGEDPMLAWYKNASVMTTV